MVWGMPGYVAQAGLADRVLPLALIADEIVQRVRAQKRPGDSVDRVRSSGASWLVPAPPFFLLGNGSIP